jgi:DNA-binding GntR family transcriptional regulator
MPYAFEIETQLPRMRARRTAAGGPSTRIKNHPNLKDVAEEFISQGIVSGDFLPGAKVDQDEVAEILGISRLPVREALIELAQKGFVTAVPRRGAFVADLGMDDVDDHFEVLGMAFALASRRAATNLSAEQLVELRGLHTKIESVDEQATHLGLNREFIQTINHAGSSTRLLSILGFLSGALPGKYYITAGAWAATEQSFREEILAALEARDAGTAARVATEHTRACAKVTIEELHARGYWTDSRKAFDSSGSRRVQD